MAPEAHDKIKWWHKAIGVIALFALNNQIRGCFDSGNNKQTTFSRNESNGNLFSQQRKDACSFIHGQQYPYDWEGSTEGACVIKLPPVVETVMIPDILTGTTLVPQQQITNNKIRIYTPIGSGHGNWDGSYISGTILTANGEYEFACAGTSITNSSRGICGVR